MSAEYFEARERALLGERYDTLYAAPQETAARGVTVSALRTTPEEFAARADFPLRPSPFCKAAFVVEQPDFKPGRHPYHHAGVFYSGCGCWIYVLPPAVRAASSPPLCRRRACW